MALKKAMTGGKKIWGRKRHLLVDTQGLLLAVKVLAANRSDLEGAKRMLEPLRNQFPRLEKVWGDSHYGGTLIAWVKEHLGWEIEPVKPLKLPLPEKISPAQILLQWDRFFPGPSQLRAKRWVVERTIAWIVRCRRLARDFEGLPSSSEAFIQLAMSRLTLSRLAPAFP